MTSLRHVPDLWGRLHVTVRDLPFGLLLLVGSLLPDLQNHGTQIGGVPDRPYDALAVVAVSLQCLPLAVRRRLPIVCVVLVCAGFALDQLRGYHAFAGTALPVALLSAGAHLERHRRLTVVLLTAAYLPFALALGHLGTGEGPAGFLVFYLAVALAWGIGCWLRSTRVAEAERRRLVAAESRAAERARIARELHDVVTHHVTAMVVQAEAARYLTAAPERLDRTLATVGDTGRRAVTDLRHLLDLINPEHASGQGHNQGQGQNQGRNQGQGHDQSHGPDTRTPPVGRLLTLVEQTRRAGQPVEFTEEGTPAEASGSADLVAYRVVQEALTNALKYAHGGGTSVRVQHRERDITVKVGTDGSGSAVRSPGGSGRGLDGLRERVHLLGGEFRADREGGGGFVVQARIPTGGPS